MSCILYWPLFYIANTVSKNCVYHVLKSIYTVVMVSMTIITVILIMIIIIIIIIIVMIIVIIIIIIINKRILTLKADVSASL